MLTTQVALVPLEPQDADFNSQLMVVASSLQTQVTRDFGPVWGVSAVVSAFLSLTDVPPQYVPVILTGGDLPADHHGFHIAADGRPFALVHLDDTWPLAASHELLEMVLDPNGDLTVSGPSIADEYASDSAATPIANYATQGTVDYLVEACDPVESSTYEINGVTVSDFVTPSFYDDFPAAGRQYSFLGSVTQPFQLLAAGYLSWRTRMPLNSVWQAFGPVADSTQGTPGPAAQSLDPKTPVEIGQLTIRQLSDVEPPRARTHGTVPEDDFVPRVSRAQVDKVKRRGNPAASGIPGPDPAWTKYETAFKSDVEKVIKLLGTTPPAPTLRDLIGLFTEAQKNGTSPDPELFTKYNVPATPEVIAAFKDPDRRANLPVIVKLLRKQEEIASVLGPGASDPDLGSWYCRLMP